MATFNLPSSIALTNPINSDWNTIVRASTVNVNNPADTTTKVHWAAVGSSGLTDVFFELNNNVITVDVNNSPTGGAPMGVSKTGTGIGTDSITVTAGDTIYFHNGSGSFLFGSFVWQSSWVNAGGPNTLGVATVQWSASFTKNPGNDYWRWNVTGYNTEATDYISLYDYLPTLSSTDPPIGIRTFAASSSPTSQYGLFTPDLTKTYYIINYLSGGSSTNLNQQVLATKNFANKKVFCNFW